VKIIRRDIDSIVYDGVRTRIEVSREKFDILTKDLVDQTMYHVDDALSKAGLAPDDISYELLVGGSTLMPMIMGTVNSKFPNSEVIRNAPVSSSPKARRYMAIWESLLLPILRIRAAQRVTIS
jgi:molecular chaperone DnaK (HSP70)